MLTKKKQKTKNMQGQKTLRHPVRIFNFLFILMAWMAWQRVNVNKITINVYFIVQPQCVDIPEKCRVLKASRARNGKVNLRKKTVRWANGIQFR